MPSSFLPFYLIFLVALVSPGPDFLLVLKNSFSSTKASGMATALGIALGIGVHIFYSFVGIGIIISQSIILFQTIKYCGALYLFYLAYQLFRAGKTEFHVPQSHHNISYTKAFREGFLNSVLNPKTTVFFVSFFSQLVEKVQSQFLVQFFMGLVIVMTAFIWFTAISALLQISHIQKGFSQIQNGANKVFGGLLALLGLKIIMDR